MIPRNVQRWMCGFILGAVLVWPISILFIDSVPVFAHAVSAPFYYRSPGYVVRCRTEGFANSHIGQFGIAGLDDVSKIEDTRIAIWGDSFVEAVGVSDHQKMAQVVTRLSRDNGRRRAAIGIGKSGNSLADYFFQLSYYDDAVGPFAAHFIIIGDLADTLPDQPSAHGAKYVSQPRLTFEPESDDRYRLKGLRPTLCSLRLGFGWKLMQSAVGQKLRFHPGRQTNSYRESKQIETSKATKKQDERWCTQWKFLFSSLKSKTSAPLNVVMLSNVPFIEKHRIVLTPRKSAKSIAFEQFCRNNSVGYIDMASYFVQYWNEAKRFPRGFNNSHPWEGHLNANGHYLVAAAICDFLDGIEPPAARHSSTFAN